MTVMPTVAEMERGGEATARRLRAPRSGSPGGRRAAAASGGGATRRSGMTDCEILLVDPRNRGKKRCGEGRWRGGGLIGGRRAQPFSHWARGFVRVQGRRADRAAMASQEWVLPSPPCAAVRTHPACRSGEPSAMSATSVATAATMRKGEVEKIGGLGGR